MARGGSLGALYYSLEARTEKLEQGINQAERRLERFAGVIKRAPAAALGAFAATAALVTVQVARMADEVDQKMRRVGNVMGATRDQVNALRRDVIAMSRETPQSADQLAAGLERIAATGERDPARAIALLREAARGATVTGQELIPVIDQLDSILDNFEGREAPEVLDLLARAGTQGAPSADVARVLAEIGPAAAAARVPLEQAIAAITTLLDAGLSAEQASRAIRSGLQGVAVDATNADANINKLGGTITVTNGHLELGGRFADGYREKVDGLAGAAGEAARQERELNGTMTAQSQILKNQFNAAFLEFGSNTLPMVITGLRALNGLLDHLNGTIHRIRQNTDLATIRTLSQTLGDLEGDSRAQSITRLREALERFWAGTGTDASRMSTENLQALVAGLSALQDAGTWWQNDTPQQLAERIRGLQTILAARPPERPAAAPSGTPAPQPRTPPSDEAQRKRQEAMRDLRQAVGELNTGIVAEGERAIAALEQKVREAYGVVTEEARGLLAQLETNLGHVRNAAGFGEILDQYEREVGDISDAAKVGTREWEDQRARVDDLVESLRQYVDQAEVGTKAHDLYNAQYQRALALLRQMGQAEERKANAAKRGADAEERALDALREQARTIEASVRGALQLAAAMGLVDDEASAALQNVVQIAANIPNALETLRQAKTGKEGVGAGEIVTAFLPIVGGIASLAEGILGESPEEQARREVLQRNSEAIERLTMAIGDWQLDLTGTQLTGVEQAVQDIMKNVGQVGSGRGGIKEAQRAGIIGDQLPRRLQQLGLTMDDLRQVANQLNISFAGTVPTARELEQLLRAIQEVELTRFAETFQGQMDLLQAELDGLDIDDPIEQLRRLAAVAAEFSPALAGVTAGLDLAQEADRAEAERRIEALIAELKAGTLTTSQLGNLTPEEFLRALLDLERRLDDTGAAGGGPTQGFTIDRTVTEVTASRLGSLLTTSVFHEARIDANTARSAELLQQLLTQAPRGPVLPPTWEELDRFTGQTAPIAIQVNVVVQLQTGTPAGPGQPPISPEDAKAAGEAIGEAAVQALDEKLGERRRQQERARGKVTL